MPHARSHRVPSPHAALNGLEREPQRPLTVGPEPVPQSQGAAQKGGRLWSVFPMRSPLPSLARLWQPQNPRAGPGLVRAGRKLRCVRAHAPLSAITHRSRWRSGIIPAAGARLAPSPGCKGCTLILVFL